MHAVWLGCAWVLRQCEQHASSGTTSLPNRILMKRPTRRVDLVWHASHENILMSVAGRGLCLRTAEQHLSCDLIDVQEIVIRDYHMIVKSAGKEI